MIDRRTESQIQASFIQSLRYLRCDVWFAVPNGAKFGRNARFAAMQNGKLVREGMRPGVPDFILPAPRCGFSGVAIEFKAHGNKPTDEQGWWLDALSGEGWIAVWTRSDANAFGLVENYLRGTRADLKARLPTEAQGYLLDIVGE